MPAKDHEPTETRSSEEKARLVLDGLRAPERIDQICAEAGISAETYADWREAFLAGGRKALSQEAGGLDDAFYRKIVMSFPGNLLVVTRF